MFEFTQLGVLVLVVGSLYLFTVGYRLLPERVPPEDDYLTEYEMSDYLAEVVVGESSPLVGKTVSEAIDVDRFDADVLQLVRGDERFIRPIGQKVIRPGTSSPSAPTGTLSAASRRSTTSRWSGPRRRRTNSNRRPRRSRRSSRSSSSRGRRSSGRPWPRRRSATATTRTCWRSARAARRSTSAWTASRCASGTRCSSRRLGTASTASRRARTSSSPTNPTNPTTAARRFPTQSPSSSASSSRRR